MRTVCVGKRASLPYRSLKGKFLLTNEALFYTQTASTLSSYPIGIRVLPCTLWSYLLTSCETAQSFRRSKDDNS